MTNDDGSRTRPRVVLLFGGRSSEHAISCVSAGSVLQAIDAQRWDVLPVGVAPDGRWLLVDADPAALAIRDGVLPQVREGRPVVLAPTGDAAARLVAVDDGADLGRVDVVWPLLHGPWGEDGSVQGLLETVGVRYVGSGVLASAVCMDKAAMKAALAAHGLPVGPYEVVHDGEWRLGPARVADRIAFALELPVFVKPARAGSSIGISRVTSWDGLPAAIDAARLHDPTVVVEQGIAGAELECGVLDAGPDDLPRASSCARIAVGPGHDFYDFEAKYLDDAAELIVPADIPDQVAARVRDTAVRAFAALGCEGLARVDFFLGDDGALLVNEVNTMPGFTPSSLFPRMWADAGVDYPALCDALLSAAAQRSTGLR